MTVKQAAAEGSNDDLFLQGVALGLLSSAMKSGDREALMGAVAALRERGVDVAAIYPIARLRNLDTPTLEDLQQIPASAASTSSEVR